MENLSSHLQKFPIVERVNKVLRFARIHKDFQQEIWERGQVQRDLSGSVGERRLREAVGHVAG